jgi:oligosaccharide repeat unit polymerase
MLSNKMTKQIKENDFSTIRLLLIAAIIFMACLNVVSEYICAGLLIVIFFWDFTYYLGIKNIFLGYTFLIFDFAGCSYFYPKSNELFIDMIIYLIAFKIGSISYISKSKTSKTVKYKDGNSELNDAVLKRIEYSLLLPFVTRIALLFYNISKVGLVNFFAGQGLANKIESYGQENFQQGLDTIVTNLESSFTTALIVLYISTCLRMKKKVNYRFPVILMVFLPLISLQRSSVIFGLLFLLMTLYFENKRGLILKIMIGLFVSILVGTSIGALRDSSLSGSKSSNSSSDPWEFIYGELSPITAYQEIKESVVKNGYQYGYTIVAPLITKPLPRNWFIDKPLNSSAYYMKTYRQAEFDAGFMLAPSIFGDMYLNFGYIGCVLMCIVLGYLFKIFDYTLFGNPLTLSSSQVIPYLMIFYNSFYAFLRNNLADSIFTILLTIALHKVTKKLMFRN